MSSEYLLGIYLGYSPNLVGVGGIKLPLVLIYSTILITSFSANVILLVSVTNGVVVEKV